MSESTTDGDSRASVPLGEALGRAMFGDKYTEQQDRLREMAAQAAVDQAATARMKARQERVASVVTLVCCLAVGVLVLAGCVAGVDAVLRYVGAI